MKRTILITAAGALLAFVAAPAWAGTIKLSDTSAFSGAATVVDFETGVSDDVLVPVTSGATFGGLYGESDPGALPLFSNSGAGTMAAANYFMHTNGGFTLGSSVTIDFASAMARVGFDVVTNPLDDIEIELFTLSGGTYTSLGTADSFTTGLTDAFVGVQSTLAFDRATIRAVGGSNGAFVMDNVRFEAIAVPLPPAAYMGLGLLVGVGLLRRRRRRRLV